MGDTNIADQRVQIMRNNRCEQCEFHSHLARTRTRITAALTQRRRHRGNPTGSRYGGLAFRPLQECSSVVEAGESVWRVAWWASASLLEDHLVETVDLVGGADAQRGALVDAGDLDVEHRAAGDAVRRLAARRLDKVAEGSRLEGQADLGGR